MMRKKSTVRISIWVKDATVSFVVVVSAVFEKSEIPGK